MELESEKWRQNVTRLGLLSDSHNNLANLQRALAFFRQEGIGVLCYCGDMTSPSMAEQLRGFKVIYLLGNMDGRHQEIQRALYTLDQDNSVGLTYTGRLGNASIAATHGHLWDRLEDFIQGGQYDYVFHGHTHRRRNEMVGQTRVLNPGALGGARHEDRSICILDLEKGYPHFVKIADY